MPPSPMLLPRLTCCFCPFTFSSCCLGHGLPKTTPGTEALPWLSVDLCRHELQVCRQGQGAVREQGEKLGGPATPKVDDHPLIPAVWKQNGDPKEFGVVFSVTEMVKMQTGRSRKTRRCAWPVGGPVTRARPPVGGPGLCSTLLSAPALPGSAPWSPAVSVLMSSVALGCAIQPSCVGLRKPLHSL